MIYKIFKTNRGLPSNKGFMAVTAVILLALGTISFSLVTMSAAISYADTVNRHELRIQARFNANACLDTATLMIAKDYFLNGEVSVPEFGCIANIENYFNGNVLIKVKAELGGVGGS